MPVIIINGERITVGDQFDALSPEEQQRTVNEIAAQMSGPPKPPTGGSIADPLGKGITLGLSDEIAGGLGATVNSVANLFGKGTGDSFGEAYTGIRDAARANEAAFAERNPKTAIAAEIGGGLLTGGAGAARAAAGTVGRQAIGRLATAGAAEGGTYGFGASEEETLGGLAKDTAIGATVGGVTGGLVPAVGQRIGRGFRDLAQRTAPGRLTQPANSTVTFQPNAGNAPRLNAPTVPAAATQTTARKYLSDVRILEGANIGLTTGQRAGSAAVKNLETTIDKTFWGGAVEKTFRRQREQLQTRLLRLAGAPDEVAATGRIDNDTLDALGAALSERYTTALTGRTLQADNTFLSQILDVVEEHSQMLGAQQKAEINQIATEFWDRLSTEPITGQRYQQFRSLLGDRARQTWQQNQPIARLYYSLQDALDEAFLRQTGTSNQLLNQQWAHYRIMRDLWQRQGGTMVAQGELPLASLNAASKKRPASDEWRRLVDAASAVMGDTANSGTASRLANIAGSMGKWADVLTGGVPKIIINQALAHGIGGGLPNASGAILDATGNAVQGAANRLGPGAGVATAGQLPQPPNQELALLLAEQERQRNLAGR